MQSDESPIFSYKHLHVQYLINLFIKKQQLTLAGPPLSCAAYALISSGVTKYCLDSSISMMITSPNLDLIKTEAIALSYTNSSAAVTHAHPSLLSEWSVCGTADQCQSNLVPSMPCASGCMVECRICNQEVAGSNLGLGYFAPRST